MFLHPFAIFLGLAAATLPVVVHFLTRPRPVRLPISTLRFVQEVVHQRRARHRLRDFLVLLLRTAAVLLLAFAIARPLIGDRPAVSAVEPGDSIRVVLLDVSQSLTASSSGVQVFERARTLAADYLNYRPGLQANLILVGTAPRGVFDHPSNNFASLREELSQARPRPERAKVQAALNQAADMLSSAGGAKARRELVIVSDFQRSNWASADFTAFPAETRIELESASSATGLVNFGILRVGSRGRAEPGREFRLEVDVGNYSPAAQVVQVEIELGAVAYRLEGLCAAGGMTTLSTEAVLRETGWQIGEARLTGIQDNLPDDNVRPFVLEVRPPPTYLLVSRQAADRRPSSSYFVERALVPFLPDESRSLEKVVRIGPAGLDRETASAADLLVFDHPGKLPPDAIQLVASLLRRGRGILYIAAEPMDATNLKLLADAAGSDLQMPVEFAPPSAGQLRRNLFLTEVDRQRPPFEVFGDEAGAVLDPLRFSGGLASRKRENGLPDDVLARFSDGSAGLVITNCGAGAVAVLNADLGTSSLPGSQAFVPLLGEIVTQLLGHRQVADAASCGEPLAVYLPPEAGTADGLRIVEPEQVHRPSGERGELADEPIGVLWREPAAGPPGIYKIQKGNRIVFSLATAAPAEECELQSLPPNVIQGRLAGGRNVHYRSASENDRPKDDLWAWLLVGCIGCMCCEVITLKAFGT